MSVYGSLFIEMELSAGVWTNVITDVLQAPGISGKQGMPDSSPTTRVAETGSFNFTLRNDESNTSGLNNRYTPGHANCIAGFKSGIAVRLRIKYEYLPAQTIIYGHIPPLGIDIQTGLFTSRVKVECSDYMEQLAAHEMYLPTFTTLKKMESVAPLIVANIPLLPLATQYNAGETTYAAPFDMLRPKTRAIGEFNKLAISEPGYVYTHPEYKSGMASALLDEVLETDGQLTRTNTVTLAQVLTVDMTESELLQEDGETLLQEDGETILLDIASVEGDAIFNDSMSSLEMSHGANYFNMVKIIIPSRTVDVDANTVLFSNPKPFYLTSGVTKIVKGNFRDPANPEVK